MIITGPAGPANTAECRVDIQVNTVVRPAGSRGVEGESDIVVDYLDPDGPTVHHLAPWLAPPAQR
jgi:hypothetical protein